MNKRIKSILGTLMIATVLFFAGRWALGFRTLTQGHSTEAPLAEDYAAVLAYATPSGFDYAGLNSEGFEQLRRYVDGLAHHGPKTTPQLYLTDAHRLSYYINSYNALVLYAVLENLPIKSVQDVHGPFEPKAGFGFFYALSFHLDGQRINLYDLENKIIRGFGDSRIHAAINCASESCPTLRGTPFTAEQLDAQLEDSYTSFCESNKHVSLGTESVQVSAIFDWFREDFVTDEQTLEQVISQCAQQKVKNALTSKRFGIAFKEYDWRLNQALPPSATGSTHK